MLRRVEHLEWTEHSEGQTAFSRPRAWWFLMAPSVIGNFVGPPISWLSYLGAHGIATAGQPTDHGDPSNVRHRAAPAGDMQSVRFGMGQRDCGPLAAKTRPARSFCAVFLPESEEG